MAACKDCGRRLAFSGNYGGRCLDCSRAAAELQRLEREHGPEYAKDATIKSQEVGEEIEKIVLTTETASSLEIIERIEIITAECAYGMNIFKDLFSGIRDVVGGRSKAMQETMREARRTALIELKREAHSVGANAVVGVDLDYVELSGAGNMVMLVASGTAVKAKL
ncbi:YbjQ family protein [uncultured Paracoccus sp.]|uniref:YbjQ family protein n=1 Tax=uncultured Paracoccus sp. TaxID=189685 RepID=UPI00261E32A4|nr:YbjQ family protein [uncultured Paracoccus sp.]